MLCCIPRKEKYNNFVRVWGLRPQSISYVAKQPDELSQRPKWFERQNLNAKMLKCRKNEVWLQRDWERERNPKRWKHIIKTKLQHVQQLWSTTVFESSSPYTEIVIIFPFKPPEKSGTERKQIFCSSQWASGEKNMEANAPWMKKIALGLPF